MKNTTKTGFLKTIVVSALVATTINTTIGTAAQAVVSDPVTYSRLMQQRRALMSKEFDLLKDKDELLRQMDDLKKQDDYATAGVLNEVSESLDQTNASLQRTRMDIRDVNRRLM